MSVERDAGEGNGMAETMRAVVHSELGGPEVLRLVERPVPEPGPGEVRVRVAVSGVNPTDWKNRSGRSVLRAEGFAETVPNQDGAGTVDAVGEGVTRVGPGDRVWIHLAAAGRPTGTAQQFTVVPEQRVALLPEAASFDVGATLGVPAMTAYRALTLPPDGPRSLHPGALDGTTVLVAGGAGVVGHAAIQLARWAGAEVIATISSPAKAALATAAGAHHVVNYREQHAATAIRELAPHGVNLIVEVAPSTNAELDLAVLAPHGTVVIYSTDGGPTLSLDIGRHMALSTTIRFALLYTVPPAELVDIADGLYAALADGALEVGEWAGLPLTRFALADTASAHAALEHGGVVGRVLIDAWA